MIIKNMLNYNILLYSETLVIIIEFEGITGLILLYRTNFTVKKTNY